jgi:hypothetical protein
MASEEAGGGGRILATVLRSLKFFLVNSWRRLFMLGRYTLICWYHLRLRRAWRLLGKRVHLSVEEGEVNPMLAGEVKDSLARVQAIQAQKNRHSQAVAALREKIRAERAKAPPAPEAESASAGESEPRSPMSGT